MTIEETLHRYREEQKTNAANKVGRWFRNRYRQTTRQSIP